MKIRNPNIEIRNKFEIRISKERTVAMVSDFGFRDSNFAALTSSVTWRPRLRLQR